MADRRIALLVVSVRGAEPRVWRRIRVPENVRLDRLHWAIQAAMGWEGQHAFEFEIGGARFAADVDQSDAERRHLTDARKATLAKLKPRRGEAFRYRYRGGGRDEHDIVLESLDWADDAADEFACIDGSMLWIRDEADADADPTELSPAVATHVLRLLASAGVLGDHA